MAGMLIRSGANCFPGAGPVTTSARAVGISPVVVHAGGGPLSGGRHDGRRIGEGGRRAAEGTTAGQGGGVNLGQAGEGGGVGRGVALAVPEDGGGGGGVGDLAGGRIGWHLQPYRQDDR